MYGCGPENPQNPKCLDTQPLQPLYLHTTWIIVVVRTYRHLTFNASLQSGLPGFHWPQLQSSGYLTSDGFCAWTCSLCPIPYKQARTCRLPEQMLLLVSTAEKLRRNSSGLPLDLPRNASSWHRERHARKQPSDSWSQSSATCRWYI